MQCTFDNSARPVRPPTSIHQLHCKYRSLLRGKAGGKRSVNYNKTIGRWPRRYSPPLRTVSAYIHKAQQVIFLIIIILLLITFESIISPFCWLWQLYTHFGTNPLRSMPTSDPNFRTEVGIVRTEVGKDRSGRGPKWVWTEVGWYLWQYDRVRHLVFFFDFWRLTRTYGSTTTSGT